MFLKAYILCPIEVIVGLTDKGQIKSISYLIGLNGLKVVT